MTLYRVTWTRRHADGCLGDREPLEGESVEALLRGVLAYEDGAGELCARHERPMAVTP
jgi:hypothetical protein